MRKWKFKSLSEFDREDPLAVVSTNRKIARELKKYGMDGRRIREILSQHVPASMLRHSIKLDQEFKKDLQRYRQSLDRLERFRTSARSLIGIQTMEGLHAVKAELILMHNVCLLDHLQSRIHKEGLGVPGLTCQLDIERTVKYINKRSENQYERALIKIDKGAVVLDYAIRIPAPRTDQQCIGSTAKKLFDLLWPVIVAINERLPYGHQLDYKKKDCYALIAELFGLYWIDDFTATEVKNILRNFETMKGDSE